MAQTSPKVIDHYPFEFYGTYFTSVLANNRHLYIPVSDMCQALGLAANAQLRRIREDAAIADALVMLTLDRSYGDEAVQNRDMYCLRLDRLPYWLGTLDAKRVKAENREKVVHFQREFAEVAWAAFRSYILPPDVLAELDTTLSPHEQTYMQLMDEAARLRVEVETQDTRLHQLEKRVQTIEARLVGTDYINSAQKKLYTDMVGIVAHVLRQKQKGNEATVHAEVKRQFQVPSYQLIPEEQFGQVRQYLRQWYLRLVGHDAAVPAIFDADQPKLL